MYRHLPKLQIVSNWRTDRKCAFCRRVSKKGLFATLCLSLHLSVCPSAWNNSAPSERIFTKFDTGYFVENLSRNSSFIKICQE